ncbi:MAG: glutamate 5-kinase, partial [Clostridia bacterium]|nr:glutamate 5-kinase [Clostridia bacterium]
AAIVAETVGAELLVILSDIDGLYSADPHSNPDAKLIPFVGEITDDIRKMTGGSGSSLGTGGMVTKIKAAEIATGAGCDVVIARGDEPSLLYGIIAGEKIGTRFGAVKK